MGSTLGLAREYFLFIKGEELGGGAFPVGNGWFAKSIMRLDGNRCPLTKDDAAYTFGIYIGEQRYA